jgi:hypothetical protein
MEFEVAQLFGAKKYERGNAHGPRVLTDSRSRGRVSMIDVPRLVLLRHAYAEVHST